MPLILLLNLITKFIFVFFLVILVISIQVGINKRIMIFVKQINKAIENEKFSIALFVFRKNEKFTQNLQ